MSVILFGLASAISWGAGDFSGGLASKRTSAYTVVGISQFVSLLLLIIGAVLIPEGSNSARDMVIGAIAGIFGASGLVALYGGLARGPMGLVAPLTAVVAAVVPVTVNFFSEGLPGIWDLAGFVFALAAVWMISQGDRESGFNFEGLRLPIFAGLGFGIFYVLIDQVSENAILWPLVSARGASILLILLTGWLTKQIEIPALKQIPIIVLAGFFDTTGNVFFAIATRIGRLDISAILSSLYPAVTVLLAWFILNEKLSRRQWFGVIITLVAIILITI
jgi:drug/metabolite transporter (DMT)-like permease